MAMPWLVLFDDGVVRSRHALSVRMQCIAITCKCDDCHHELLMVLSCKQLGDCHPCGARRTSETVAHLVDQFIPRMPAHQRML